MTTPGDLLGGGFGLIRQHPKAVAIWTAAYLALMVPMVLVAQRFSAAMARNVEAVQLGAVSPVSAAFPSGVLGPMALLYLLLLLLSVAIFAAAVRAVTRGGNDAFGFLRFGMDELRLIGLTLLFILAAIVVEIVLILVIVVAVGAASVAGGVAAGVIGTVLGIAALCVAVWLQIRLSLAGALTVMRGKFIIGESWTATRGHFWTLFGTYLLLGIAYLMFSGMVIALTNPGLMAAYSHVGNPAAMQAAMQAQASQAASLSPLRIVGYLLSGIIGMAMFAVIFGVAATAAREFSRDRLEGVF